MENQTYPTLSSMIKGDKLEHLLHKLDHVKYVPYGTAGFRGKAKDIEHLFTRVGLITGIKCWTQRANVGVMITASHNPIEDNGVKIVDSMGEMINSEWEKFIEKFCNLETSSVEELLEALSGHPCNEDLDSTSQADDTSCKVYIGCDNRPSSEKFVDLVTQGLAIINETGLKYEFMGEMTTPALHHIVAEATLRPTESITCTDYYDKLLFGFVDLFERSKDAKQHYDSKELVVDCANGVGAKTMQYLNQAKDGIFRRHLPFKLINISLSSGDILNFECGADFVKTKNIPPRGATELNKRYASLDGDADRVVYFYLDGDPATGLKLILLDGDKILALYAKYITDALRNHHLEISFTLGAIQTAYANGASTDYLKHELGLDNVDCVDTGVKHLHKRATNFDIGVYFEANGHGTIWFSPKACAIIEQEEVVELQRLRSILNNYTGDAVSDILITEMILHHYDWDVKQWEKLYQARANSLIKVEVADRNLVVTTNAGRTCLRPIGLQDEVDKLVSQFGQGSRSFVRASGTEDVVRVYAESSNQELADQLAQLVGQKLKEFCDR